MMIRKLLCCLRTGPPTDCIYIYIDLQTRSTPPHFTGDNSMNHSPAPSLLRRTAAAALLTAGLLISLGNTAVANADWPPDHPIPSPCWTVTNPAPQNTGPQPDNLRSDPDSEFNGADGHGQEDPCR